MKLHEIKTNVKPKAWESKCQLTEEEEKVLRGTQLLGVLRGGVLCNLLAFFLLVYDVIEDEEKTL